MRSFVLPLVMLSALCAAPLAAQEPGPAAEQTQPPATDSHAELADALVNLLQRTVATLESCTDTASAEAALPQLEEQRREAESLMARQAALPEPTVQDYMAAQNRANDFLDAKRALQTQIARLQTAQLMSAEIRRILGIAPETAPADE